MTRLLSSFTLARLRAISDANLGTSSNAGVSLVLYRAGASQAAQDVRLEWETEAPVVDGQMVSREVLRVAVVGTLDLDIEIDDTFTLNGVQFKVIQAPRPVAGATTRRRALAEST